MNKTWRILIDGIELFGADKKKIQIGKIGLEHQAIVSFVIHCEGDLVHT